MLLKCIELAVREGVPRGTRVDRLIVDELRDREYDENEAMPTGSSLCLARASSNVAVVGEGAAEFGLCADTPLDGTIGGNVIAREGENPAGEVCKWYIDGLDFVVLSVGGRVRQKGLYLRIERSHLRDDGEGGREE